MNHLVCRKRACKLSICARDAEAAQDDDPWQKGLLAIPKRAVHLLCRMTPGAAELVASKFEREGFDVWIPMDSRWSPILCPRQDSRRISWVTHSQYVRHACRCHMICSTNTINTEFAQAQELSTHSITLTIVKQSPASLSQGIRHVKFMPRIGEDDLVSSEGTHAERRRLEHGRRVLLGAWHGGQGSLSCTQ